MKEDYLWDKTGEDPEIEKLENALQAFRYKETAPPAFAAKVIPFRKETPRTVFRFTFAFAACATFVIVSLGVWFQFLNNKTEIGINPEQTIAPQKNVELSKAITDVKPKDAAPVQTIVKNENPKQISKQGSMKVGKIIPVISRQNKTIARNIKIEKPAVRLTKNEKYAYDQLMLALSITSSKLKLVKDKVEGIEEQNAVLENGR